jgi:prepilin-type N-terminal cleavage/methylation domain-containing protein
MRRGFTLLELLVAIAIIAVLVAMLIPAVQKVREAAARARSVNQLRQLAIGAHNYAATNDQLLPGTGRTRFEGSPVAYFDLLPFVEAGAVYDEFRVSGGVIVPPAEGGPTRVVGAYLNPQDTTNPARVSAARGWGCASYTPNPAVFGDNATLATIRDGTSNTTMFGERLMRCRDVDNPWFATTPDELVFGAAPPQENFGPTAEACNPERVSAAQKTAILVAMADGSCRSVSPAAAARYWVAAASPDDGNVPGPEW